MVVAIIILAFIYKVLQAQSTCMDNGNSQYMSDVLFMPDAQNMCLFNAYDFLNFQ